MTADERAEAPERDLDGAELTGEQAPDEPEDSAVEDSAIEDDVVLDGELLSDDEPAPSDLARAEQQRDEYLDALLRLQAEFDNYRKRVDRLQAEQLERANHVLVERLLPVLDALDLALEHTVGAAESDDADARQALVQIAALLAQILTKEGLERIDASEVEFDPTIHDAVAHEAPESPEDGADSDTAADHHIVDTVMRAGYRLKGRVLRPAMVKVRG